MAPRTSAEARLADPGAPGKAAGPSPCNCARPGPCATFAATDMRERQGNYYSGTRLDRADHLRRDRAWLEAALRAPESRLVPVWRARNLVVHDPAQALWLAGHEAAALIAWATETPFLGLGDGTAYFALALPDAFDPDAEPMLAGRGELVDLRAVGPLLPRDHGAILAYARGLVHWHGRHRFCGLCGAPTESHHGGHLRACVGEGCGAEHFPRTDPAVIMLVHDGGRCVLGRQKHWPDGMHSTLAGFVEPGESLEEAVVREVMEEVGLEVVEVCYHSSQPWPFPSSLMLGFHAVARAGPLRLNPGELAGAAWFSRAALKSAPEDARFRLPRRDSIARRLIEDWLTQD